MKEQDKDELRKSLLDLDFSEAEVDEMITKAEKEGKFEKEEKKEEPATEDDKTIDQEAAEKAQEKEEDEVKKAYDGICKMKCDLDKAMTDFLDKFGSMPGVKTPDSDFTKKAEEDQLNKSIENDFEKSFGSRFDDIQKGFESQNKINEEIVKSLQNLTTTVNQIAETPNPLKSILGKYGFIEKGEKTNELGKKVVNLKNKEAVQNEISKAMDKVENEDDKQVLRDMLSDYTISNKTNPLGLDIVKKALDIDFEK